MTEYKRDLGLKESVAIVISRIIGSGIFRTPAPIMALVGCTSLFGLVWIIGGIITIFGAVIYAELTAMLPKSGGPYVFLKEAYGPYIAFIRGWAMFFVSETASIVAVALVFTEYLNAIWEITMGTQFNLPVTFAISFITIWGLRPLSFLYNNKFHLVHGSTHQRLKIKEEFNFKTYCSFFLLLGLLQITIMSPVIYINFLPGSGGFNLLDYMGLLVFIFGWIIEKKSDRTLKEFKKLPQNKSRVLKTNLWSYCRHPNYFGNLLQWWGVYFIACNSIGGIWSFYGPLVLAFIFLLKPIKRQEQRLLSRLPEYYQYTQETNKFIPNLGLICKLLTSYLLLLSPKKSITYVFGFLSQSKNTVIKNILFFKNILNS